MENREDFRHKHSLVLDSEFKFRGEVCFGCQGKILEPSSYYCVEENCRFFLHKKCANLPMEIMHWRHSLDHPLRLKCHPYQQDMYRRCVLCLKKLIQGFFYTCPQLCHFVLCVPCSFEVTQEREIKLDIHEHPFTVIPKIAMFECDACGEISKDSRSYFCKICHFWIHKSCASLPFTRRWSLHDHRLYLDFSAFSNRRKSLLLSCSFCKKRIPPGEWNYSCDFCNYFLHVKCLKKYYQLTKDESRGLYLVQLPRTDMSIDLVSKPYNMEPTQEKEITHFSHQHPLTLSDDPSIDDLENGQEILCDGCVEPISSNPYYSCASCSYFLHTSCARLRDTLQAEPKFHSEGFLLEKEVEHPERHFTCKICHRSGNGFFITAVHEPGSGKIHMHCAMLVAISVTHQAHHHDHRIAQKYVSDMSDIKQCSACNEDFPPSTTAFICTTGCSNFSLHPHCMALPRTVRHRWDTHKLVLKYNSSFATDPSEEFYCEICEEQIKDDAWRYHCTECNQAFHPFCIPRLGKDRFIKFGGVVQVEEHQHPLRFVREGEYGSACSCSVAGDCKGALAGEKAYECELCDFSLCHPCLCQLKSK